VKLRIRLKIITDILLFLSGLVSMITGLALLILPSGPGNRGGIALSTSSILDLTARSGLKILHDWSSMILIALIIFHLILNWKVIVCYFKNSFKPAA
jgi:hypothetical protein